MMTAMGVVCGKWNFADGEPPGAEVVADALRAATGLEVNVDKGRLCFPGLGLEFWGYLIEDASCEVLSPVPAPPTPGRTWIGS